MTSKQIEQEIMDTERYMIQLGILKYTVRDKTDEKVCAADKCFTRKFLKHYFRCKNRIYQRINEEYPEIYNEDEEFDNGDSIANYEVILTYLGLFTEKELEGKCYDEYNIDAKITEAENQRLHNMALNVSAIMETNDKSCAKGNPIPDGGI